MNQQDYLVVLETRVRAMEAELRELRDIVQSISVQHNDAIDIHRSITQEHEVGRLSDVFIHASHSPVESAKDISIRKQKLCLKVYVDDMYCSRYADGDVEDPFNQDTTEVMDEVGNIGKLLLYVVQDSDDNWVAVPGMLI